MEKYNYNEELLNDINSYIENHKDIIIEKNYESKDVLYESLYEDMILSDSITGNASGSYTFSTWQAEENLCHNWDLLKEALEEFDYKEVPMDRGAEWCDVIIRCYLLPLCLEEYLDSDKFQKFCSINNINLN